MHNLLMIMSIGLLLVGCSRPTSQATFQAPATADSIALSDKTVGSVTITGNSRVPEEALRDVVTTTVGMQVDASRIRNDVRALFAIDGIADVRVLAERQGDTVAITFHLRETMLVSSVTFHGNTVFDDDVLRGVTRAIEVDAPFRPEQVTAIASRLAEIYQAAGHPTVETTWKTTNDEDAVRIEFLVKEGEKALVSRVEFSGATQMTSQELGKAFAGEASENSVGGIFSEVAAEEGMLRLMAAYYERGHINVRVGAPDISVTENSVTIVVPITEGSAYRIGKVSVTGISDRSARQYKKLLSFRSGELFQRSKIGESIQTVAEFHRQANTAADVTPLTKVNLDAKTVDIELRVASK